MWMIGAALVGAGAVIFIAATLRSAGSVLDETKRQAASAFRVSVRPWQIAIPAGFESVGSPAEYTTAQAFHGNLYVAGPAGLAEYDGTGTLVRRFRAGVELPPAPITALVTGLAGSSTAPELWIATAGQGLVAFDGHRFLHIYPERPEQAKVTSLIATPTGRVLLGTEKAGVLVWDGAALSSFHPSLDGVPVTALEGDDADLWVGTLDRGLLHWRAGALETFKDALPDSRILSIASAGETVYAGTAAGIAEIRGSVTRVLAPGYFAQALLADSGKLWMGTLEEGMRPVPLEAQAGRGSQPGPPVCADCSIRKIFRMGADLYTVAENSLWKGAVAVLTPESATLQNRNISALATDTAGRLWIGYFDRGLQILTPAGDRGLTLEDDALFCVNRIVHDDVRGVSAVATANGLVIMDSTGARRRLVTRTDGLIASHVTDVALRPDGSWIAATPAGVSFLDRDGINSVYAFQGLVNNHVYALASSGTRTMAGTLGGLSVLDGGFVKASYTTANSALKHNWITAIVPVDREYFAGTYGAGVMRLDAIGHWESFDDLRGNIEVNPNAMAVSSQAVYAGTLDRGLAVYNRTSGRWNFFTTGLPSRNVTALEARGGTLLIGTDNGLVKVPESAVVAR